MGSKVEVIEVGDSLGIQFPDSIVKSFGLEAGDRFLVEETGGGVVLKILETREMRACRRVMRENRDVLKRLADS
ncbi:MAG TPA: AbrB/MazE/SpoVT family DNA-binding domain-containing protein [Acidobacteriaceae bacterium]|jgi:bifunctional DNA-binding transcriptional regulator/antitoxin component of YhaV-PrlF toxin-antitoxin module|nr:AbrB/MazE/SpoVT family DNA-binding domain-containing protein [Acidobacteriaceae bacterium]